MVHFGFCSGLRPRINLRFSTGCLAVRSRGGHLVWCCNAALVEGGSISVTPRQRRRPPANFKLTPIPALLALPGGLDNHAFP